jgi:hypothetical protein
VACVPSRITRVSLGHVHRLQQQRQSVLRSELTKRLMGLVLSGEVGRTKTWPLLIIFFEEEFSGIAGNLAHASALDR